VEESQRLMEKVNRTQHLPRLTRRDVSSHTTAAVAGLLIGIRPGMALAAVDGAPDWNVPEGHFYTQTSGSSDAGDLGFVISDADGIAFWRDYQRMGGPAQLGFPISSRYQVGDLVYQATQTSLLRWDPARGECVLDEVFWSLGQMGHDGWLEAARGIPRTHQEVLDDPALPAEARSRWLTHPRLRDVYNSEAVEDPQRLYGLPLSEPKRFGPYLAQRFDRAVLQLWLDQVPGQPAPGTVTRVHAGDIFKELGLIASPALEPQTAPAPRPQPEPPRPEPRTQPTQSGPAPRIVSGKYVAVSVGRQWWWAYQDGRLLNSGPVTTGRPELYTPIGRYSVLSKHSPYRFVSPWPPGSPFWYAPAISQYALRITGNGIYLHDAPWRPFYGPGTNVPHTDPDGVWRTGSHGCINMPFAAAQWLYGWAPTGTPVDVIA
jgi:lipoprotein-anchoring transpeptidase ErfK/SrfK